MTEQPASVDAYIARFPDDVAERLRQVRAAILAEVPGTDGAPPEERIRYGIAAIMLGGRYALHFAGWRRHIGLYPVPTLPEPLEAEVAPLRESKDTVVLKHDRPLPVELVGRIAAAIVAQRGAAG
ncbi:iron chaperone [Agrococcus baldri]|uniref:YdhG-like domain-containing protein n=1 Tax=Agrococcus baldri TaxID=153730 RepID=A0AA87RKM8_9MICO|nr:DUF1801 domain-containing protein [Agrococcus baldri]GEK79887.1 hypothetical protein ABA31_12380 [Agrococcus baldri]